MKIAIITFLFLLNFQVQTKPEFGDFLNFVRDKNRVSTSVSVNCDWQYAIVKLDVDENNKIIKYDILNEVSKDLRNSFLYLKGYQFNKKIPIKKRPIVFYYTIENNNDNCIVLSKNRSPSETTSTILSYFNKQLNEAPNTIFIYDPVIAMVYPTVK